MKRIYQYSSILIFTGLLVASMNLTSYGQQVISFSSLDKTQSYKLSGTVYLPKKASGPVPAVVIIHGSAGIDARGTFYRKALLDSGIAIFEVDFKTGVFTSTLDRPRSEIFVPMAFAALKELRKLPAIDPDRIGIMGFSLGGGINMRTAMEDYRKQWMGDDKGFVAHAAFYPVCRSFMKELEKTQSKLTGAPIIIFYGTADAYGEGKAVPELKSLLSKKYNLEITTVEYPGASHGFNLDAPPLSYPDPGAINGRGYMEWDAKAAKDSRVKVVAFLSQALAVRK